LPLHLLIPELRRLGAALLLLPLAASAADAPLPAGLYAEISTPKGTITCELEFTRAPLTVANFVGLAEGTLGPAPRRPFFDGLKFHRVVPHFVIQGGDPLGTGEGGPGYSFPDEFGAGLRHDAAGVLSMANDGPDTNGSQFFITLAPVERLNFLHSVFGRTVRGADVPARIVEGDAMQVRILRVGAAATAFKADDAAFAALQAKAVRYAAEPEPGPRAHFDDPDKLLPTDSPRAKAFNFKLGNVERATGMRVFARVLAKFTPGAAGQDPQAFVDSMARTLGIGDNGALAVYVADQKKGYLHLGSQVLARFAGITGDPAIPSNAKAVSAAFDRYWADSEARKQRYEAQTVLTLPNFLQTPGMEVKISVDAMLDELLAKTSS
jgi:cyclophilin family peptidyl-prolyl cis-trans isomerase